MTSLALFDLDNTLVDRQGAFMRWAHGFAGGRDLGPTAIGFLAEVDEDGFASREAVFDAVRCRFGLPESTQDLIAEYRATYLNFFEPDRTVDAALVHLKEAGWRLGVVTNGPPTQRDKLERTGLLDLLDGFCISDEFGVAKPDPIIFEEAIRRCSEPGSRPTAVWMVGDAPETDIAGGKAAGLSTIWMHRGRPWPTSTDFRPDRVAETIGEAAELMIHGGLP